MMQNDGDIDAVPPTKSVKWDKTPKIEMTEKEVLNALKCRYHNNTIVDNPELTKFLKRIRSGFIMVIRDVAIYIGNNDKPKYQKVVPLLFVASGAMIVNKEEKCNNAKRGNVEKNNMEK
jgi:hypothetical protein